MEVDLLNEAEPDDDIRTPEKIRIRRKRHLYFHLNRKTKKSRRSNAPLPHNNHNPENETLAASATAEPFASNGTTPVPEELGYETTILNGLTGKATTESQSQTHNQHGVKRPIKLVRRLPGNISNKQWVQIRKSLGLNFTDDDEEEEEQDEESSESDENNKVEKRYARLVLEFSRI